MSSVHALLNVEQIKIADAGLLKFMTTTTNRLYTRSLLQYSNSSDIVTLEPQGKSFFHGVRFSVQTISLGKLAYRTCVGNWRS